MRTQTGMTLLEVLLAVSLISVIATMAFVGLNALVDARATTQEKNTELNRLNLSLQLLTQDVQMLHQSQATKQAFTGESQRLIVERLQYSQVSGLPSAVQRIKWEWRNNRLLRSTQDVLQPGYINQWNDRLMLELPAFSCQYQDLGGIANASWPLSNETSSDIPTAVVCRLGLQDGRAYEHHMTPYAAMRF